MWSPGIASDMGGITLIPISMNFGQPCKVEVQVNQAPELHLSAASKPRRTGSLALFYRKVSVFPGKSGHAEICLLCSFPDLSVFRDLSFGVSGSYIPGRRRGKTCQVLQRIQFSTFPSP